MSPPVRGRPSEIWSGGQTGADRAALDVAIRHRFPHAGWCPRGRLAEDGTIDARYELRETPSERWVERTEWNVRDSDATVVFTLGATAFGGTLETIELAARHRKPLLHLVRGAGDRPDIELQAFVERYDVRRLNVAGPRESGEPGIYDWVSEVLEAALFARNGEPGASAEHRSDDDSDAGRPR